MDFPTAIDIAELQRLERVATRANRRAEKAKEERDAFRRRLAAFFAYNDSKDADDATELHGKRVRRIRVSSGERFDLNGFRDAHRLTPRMREFVKESSYDRWSVEDLDDED